jgi:hypothetical protein
MGIIEFELRAQQVEGDLPGTLTFQTTLIKQKQNIYTKDGERFNKRQRPMSSSVVLIIGKLLLFNILL